MQAIFDFFASIWREAWPWVFIAPDEAGVRVTTLPRSVVWVLVRCPTFCRWLRIREVPTNGQWIKDVEPGAVWKLPMFGDVRKCKVTPSYVDIDNVTVETADHKTKLVSLTAKFRVSNVRQALLRVDGYEDSISIDIQSIVTAWANRLLATEITVARLVADCTPPCREAAQQWGCRLRELGVNSIADHRVYRILQQ